MNPVKHNERLIILDSFRGIASVIVLFHHIFKLNSDYFKLTFPYYLYSVSYFVSSLNQIAVLFFFVLSGFSIGLSLKQKNLADTGVINDYFYRRFKRILPIYLFSILLAFLSGFLMNKLAIRDYSFLNLLGNVIFLQTSPGGTPAWFVPYGENGPLWSIAFEFFFYIAFPLVFLINANYLKKFTRIAKLLTALCFSMLFLVLNKLLFVPYLLFSVLFVVWLLGYVSSQCYLSKKSDNLLFLFVFFLGLAGILFQNKIRSNVIFMISQGLLINSIFYFIIVNKLSHMTSNQYWIVKLINFLFLKIGKGSYAIYAFHYPILLLFQYYNIAVGIQLIAIFLMMILCIRLEERTIKWKLSLLKINYLWVIK